MAEREYKRLTRSKMRSKGFTASFKRSSLWLGRDHVLIIQSTNFREEYKRFYFRDIQSIMIRRTKRRMVWNWTLAPLSIVSLFGLIGSLQSGGRGMKIFFVTVVAILGRDTVRDPTPRNPNHCTMCGLTPEKASELMKVRPNPSK